MDLKEFITETLVQIQEGVQEAINRRTASGNSAGAINPFFGNVNDIGKDHLQLVDFDVAVTVVDKADVNAKAGLRVFSIELGGGGSTSAEHSTVSRIKFAIPVAQPTQVVKPAVST